MGLTGCPASFARMTETAFSHAANIIAYIDDLLVHSSSWTAHLEHLEEAFRTLRKHNLKVNLDKCLFGKSEVAYLGHVITEHGARPGDDKV